MNNNKILKHIENKLGDGNFLIQKTNDVFFITRFHSSNLTLLLINGKWYALTDQRYFNAMKDSLNNFEIIDMHSKGWLKKIKEENNFDSLIIDESHHTISSSNGIKKMFANESIEVITRDFGYIRDIYLEEDLNKLREAVKINDEIFNEVKSEVKIGMTELDVYKLIMTKIINSKADKESFEPIVAAGINGANPHHHASNKVIKENEMLTIDMGVFYKGFASDMTRTFVVFGKASKVEEEIWNTVKYAVEQCISLIKPGVAAAELHNKAAQIIKDAGYDGYFNHGLGHGLGVEIHDKPVLSPRSNDILKEGQSITIEPGIYIPGKYGVRIEQDIIVTKDGCEVLQNSPIELH